MCEINATVVTADPVLLQVTLEKVFKLDRDTLLPVRDPEVVAKFTRKLQRLVSDQGAQFISYHADTGEWRFKARGFLLPHSGSASWLTPSLVVYR